MVDKQTVFASLLLVLTGCAATGDHTDRTEAEIDPRRGERVDRLCFGASIDGFGEATRTTVVVTEGRDKYLLETFNGCFDLDHAGSIAFNNRTSCLNRGDSFTPFTSVFGPDNTSFHPIPCRIKAIYEWDREPAEEQTETAKE